MIVHQVETKIKNSAARFLYNIYNFLVPWASSPCAQQLQWTTCNFISVHADTFVNASIPNRCEIFTFPFPDKVCRFHDIIQSNCALIA